MFFLLCFFLFSFFGILVYAFQSVCMCMCMCSSVSACVCICIVARGGCQLSFSTSLHLIYYHYIIHLFIFADVFVSGTVLMWRSRTTRGNQFYPSTMWILGSNSGLAVSIPLAHSTLLLETESLTEPGDYQPDKTSWPANSKDLLASISPRDRIKDEHHYAYLFTRGLGV